jgi:hypothetical protein
MPLTVRVDRTEDFARRKAEAVDAALRACAYVPYNLIKRAMAGGYTSGDFVTGRALNSVTISDPYDGDRGRAIDIGSDLDYVMCWEVGHHNIFTRRFEQVEIWRPAMDATQDETADVYAGTLLSHLVQGPE